MSNEVEFSIEAYERLAVQDKTHEVREEDGRKARVICTDCKDSQYPIIALIWDEQNEEEFVQTYTEKGRYYAGSECPSGLRLCPIATPAP